MTLLWADDFSTYGVGGQAYMLNGSYAEMGTTGFGTATLIADPDPSSPGNAVVLMSSGSYTGADTGPRMRKALSGLKTTIGGSCRLWMSYLPISNPRSPWIRLADDANTTNISFYVNTIGQIVALRGHPASGTVLGTSSGSALTANAWHHLEWKVLFSDTVGTITVKLNGTAILTLTGLDTVAGNIGCANVALANTCAFNGGDAAPSSYFRDFIVWDTVGTYNNDFMGPCFIDRFTVDSDVSFNWTASTGTTGYTLINEKGPADAGYIYSPTPAASASTFGMEDLPASAVSVRGIMLYGRMQKSDGGDCQVQMSLNDGTSDTPGTDRAITTAFTYWADILETNVTTGLPWTRTAFNASKFKINRTV